MNLGGTPKVGDAVVRDPLRWIPNAFDAWGRGLGVGEVVEPPFGLESEEVDVRWPRGRCFESPLQLAPAPVLPDLIQHDEAVLGFFVDLSAAESIESVVTAFNLGFVHLIGGHWNGNLDALNDYLYWPSRPDYTLVLYGADRLRDGVEPFGVGLKEVLSEVADVDIVWRGVEADRGGST